MAQTLIGGQLFAGSFTSPVSMGGSKITSLASGVVSGDAVHFGQLANYIASANILINGGFDFWQRGTTNAIGPAGSQYTADRWVYGGLTGASSGTISQEVGAGNVHDGASSMKVNIVSAGSATSLNITQNIENPANYGGLVLSFSQWVKTSLAGVTIAINDGSLTVSAPHPGDGAWHQLTVTAGITAVPPFLSLYACLIQGTVPTGIIYLDSAICVPGSQPVNFIPRPYGQEFILCQRYYQKTFAPGTAPAHNIAPGFLYLVTCSGGVAGNSYFNIPYKVEMRVAPTVYLYDPSGTGSGNIVRIYHSGAGTQVTSFAINPSPIALTGDCAGGNAGYPDNLLTLQYAVDAEM